MPDFTSPLSNSSDSVGFARLSDPELNKATAFTEDERDRLSLHGLLPPAYEDSDRQIERIFTQIDRKHDDLERYIFLVGLEAENQSLFYQLIQSDPGRFLPLVYTPTVGEACEKYGHIFRRPRGLYLSSLAEHPFDRAFANWPKRDVRVFCVTSGERILGLGDLGANGIGIATGKLQLYSACGGVPPAWLLPAHIDFGTNNDDLRADPLYLGLRKPRVNAQDVDRLVDHMLADLDQCFPGCMVHFEDWSGADALRLLDRYSTTRCVFNDDIQGTGAMALAAIETALRIMDGDLREQKILFLGAGSAAIGIARVVRAAMIEGGMQADDAKTRLAMFDLNGLVVRSRDDLSSHQAEFALDQDGIAGLEESIIELKPTVLIGVSGAAGAFNEKIIRAMAAINDRPIILALSNPKKHSECTAEDAYRHSAGKALFAAGSPFDPVDFGGTRHEPAQANNMVVFPGIGLAVTATRAKRVTNTMLLASARAVSALVSDDDLEVGRLLPPINDILQTSFTVARAVTECIFAEDLADCDRPQDIAAFLRAAQFDPSYENKGVST